MPSPSARDESTRTVEALEVEVARLRSALEQTERERALARALLDTSPLAITHLLPDGTILALNTTGARNMGGSPSEFEGKNIFTMFPELEQQTRARMKQSFEQAGGASVETTAKLPGGERWFRSNYCPVYDEHGAAVSVRIVSQDTTELKRMEHVLEATEGRLASVLEHAPHVVMVLDPDGVVRYANRAPTSDVTLRLVGVKLASKLPPDAARAFNQSLARVLASARSDLIELDDPSGRRWEVRLAPIMRAGNVHQLVAFAVDISDLHVARERERELEAQVQHAQKLESLGVLAGGIAHDFNNLLVGVLGNAQLALRHEPDGLVGEHLRGIVQAAQRAAELCRQMLAYAGRSQFVFEQLDLSALADEMVDLVRASISKRARVVRDCPPGLPPIEGDATQLRQVVMNLLTNASDALSGGDGEITLRCGLASGEPTGVYVEVRDDGCGMDAETQRRMFEPFFTTKQLGNGLGLAAALGIVRSHRGTLHVDSVKGRGTCVRAVFPMAEPRPVAPRRGHSQPPPTRPGTILLVDDEPTVRRVAKQALQDVGHRVIEAVDGADALELYDGDPGRIDAVVLDLSMPRMDGGQTLAELRKRDPGLPVVLASGFEPSRHESVQWGNDRATRFVAKPYTLEALLGAIDELRSAHVRRS